MNRQFSHVLSPIRVNGVFYKNRLIVAPITPHSSDCGQQYPNEDAISYFESRAKTGAALVYCGGAKAADLFDDHQHCNWDTFAFNHKNKMTMLAERIHAHGARAGMEVLGVFPLSWRGLLTCSNGNRIMESPHFGQEITKEEMTKFKNLTAEMCHDLQACGFDSLLFHFGHSIPVAQFFSPLTNHRTDEYGGSLENRCRYPIEILDACREATGGRMTMEVRMSANEFAKGGIDDAMGLDIACMLQDYCDIIQASCGMLTEKYMTYTHPCQHMGNHPNLHFAEAWKKSGRIKIPVTAVGGFESLQAAEDAVAQGKCDFVALTRQLIADPDTFKKAVDGRADDVVPCIKCMRCHDSDVYGHLFRCSVNPQVGYEACVERMFPDHATKVKRVAVVGGGPGGMEAALTAKARGHKVTLFEKSDSLGGALKFSAQVPFKYALCGYKDFLIYQCNKQKIDVKLNTIATPEIINGKFDALIVAVGAEPLMLPLPGFNADNGVVATWAYEHADSLGETIIVIGGGQVGCETALYLCDKGKNVSILEMQNSLCPDASKTCGDEIRILLQENDNFSEILGAKCKSIDKHSVTYDDKNGEEQTVTCDTVVFAAGMRSKTDLADSFITGTDIPECIEIGDCVRARTVEEAVAEGYNAAMSL